MNSPEISAFELLSYRLRFVSFVNADFEQIALVHPIAKQA